MTNITEIAKKLSERISYAETRKRSRAAEEYQRFLYINGHKKTLS